MSKPTAPTTCGEGLAAHAPLPDLIGRLARATAEVLEAHLPMLDVTDPASAREHELYVSLVAAHREAADVWARLASRMAGARTLPMGQHAQPTGALEGMRSAFQEFVEAEESLAQLLAERLAGDRHMLASMDESR